jgi:hypothetical protein
MSIGTTPLTIHVPAREPIRNRIRIAGMAVAYPLDDPVPDKQPPVSETYCNNSGNCSS